MGLLLLGAYKTWAHFSCSAEATRADPLEPISVLKPVKGSEPGLKENIETFFELDYPKYQLIFSVADAKDPARDVIQSLIRKYPHVHASLIIGDMPAGPNPKVNNLIRGYYEAKYDWVLISDSNVTVPKDYLKRKSASLAGDVGVVTAVVAGHEPDSAGGWLESVFLNTFYARWMFTAQAFGQDVVVGKSMLFRKSDAERFGGIVQLGRFLAEDFMAGQAMRMLGLKIAIMKAPVRQPLQGYRVGDFWRRHIRWGRIRKAQAPLPVFFEPWVGLMPSGVCGAFAAHALFGARPLVFLAAHALLWFVCDMSVVARLGERWGPKTALAWLAREMLALPLWLNMMSGNTVLWRGVRLRVRSGGLLETP